MDYYEYEEQEVIAKTMEEIAIENLILFLTRTKNGTYWNSKDLQEKYSPLMFLIDMNVEDYRHWIHKAMDEFFTDPYYNQFKAHLNDGPWLNVPSLANECLLVKNHRKEKQKERKKRKNKEGE